MASMLVWKAERGREPETVEVVNGRPWACMGILRSPRGSGHSQDGR